MDLPQKILVYDEHCAFCTRSTLRLEKMGLLKGIKRLNFNELDQLPNAPATDWERSEAEMPLLDTTGGPALYGAESVVFLIQRRWPILGRLLNLKPMRFLARHAYLFASTNRRILSPVVCDTACPRPVLKVGYRLAFLFFAALLSTVISLGYGLALDRHLVNHGYEEMATGALALVGMGWIIQALIALRMPKLKRWQYWGHLGYIASTGVLVLLPFILLDMWLQPELPWLLALGTLCSSSIMLWQHHFRIKVMGLSQGWTISWFAALQVSAAVWLAAHLLGLA